MLFSKKVTCYGCAKHIQIHKPSLKCEICEHYFCPKCNNLKPSDVKLLKQLNLDRTWSCITCINNIFPFPYSDTGTSNVIRTTPLQSCHSCTKFGTMLQTCDICSNLTHAHCFSGPIGCRSCMQDTIPGFNVNTCELFCRKSEYADKIFNPFDRNSDINNIGSIDNELGEFEQEAWAPCSNILENCKYYELEKIPCSRAHELKVLSLNIRSINDKVCSIRDDINHYSKFDILCFNETCCSIDRLPFGGKELELEPFYPSIV